MALDELRFFAFAIGGLLILHKLLGNSNTIDWIVKKKGKISAIFPTNL